jgi:hypothetical protein
MKTKYGIVTVALIGSLALSAPALAAGKGQTTQKQTSSTTQTQSKQQSKTGSGTQTGTMGTKSQAGKTYGPGDGAGNQGWDQRPGLDTEHLATGKS